MATRRTTLAGMLADHGIRPADAGTVGIGTETLIDSHSQVAALGRLDPTNPALPGLRQALQQNPGAVPAMLGQVQGTQPGWRQWLPLLLGLAGLLGVWWYYSARKRKRRRRRNDTTFEFFDLDVTGDRHDDDGDDGDDDDGEDEE